MYWTYWCIGVLMYWCIDVLVYWCIGVLMYWCIDVSHQANNRFVSVPFPAAYHWWDGIKELPWVPQHGPDARYTRNMTAVYLGSTQTLNPAHTKIRRAMTAQCNVSTGEPPLHSVNPPTLLTHPIYHINTPINTLLRQLNAMYPQVNPLSALLTHPPC